MALRQLFNTNNSATRLWGRQNRGSEISLREEMDTILFGSASEPPKGYWLVIRQMRRVDGQLVSCTCKDEYSGEGSTSCPYCLGEGYLWDEIWKIGRAQYIGSEGGLGNKFRYPIPGRVKADTKVFFFRYDTVVKSGDKIVEMKLDDEGVPVKPYVREVIYTPQTINYLRSDFGRKEYLAVHCLEKDALRIKDV